MRRHLTATGELSGYLFEWLRSALFQSTVPKVSMTAFVGILSERAYSDGVLLYVLALWLIDFLLGATRALADPEQRLDVAKARRGLLRLLAIPLITYAAALIEMVAGSVAKLFGDEVAVAMGVGLGGKLVLLALVAMAWEEAISIQRNGRYFYRALRLRFTLPWRDEQRSKPDGDGNDA